MKVSSKIWVVVRPNGRIVNNSAGASRAQAWARGVTDIKTAKARGYRALQGALTVEVPGVKAEAPAKARRTPAKAVSRRKTPAKAMRVRTDARPSA